MRGSWTSTLNDGYIREHNLQRTQPLRTPGKKLKYRHFDRDEIMTIASTSQRVRIIGITPDHGLLRTLPLPSLLPNLANMNTQAMASSMASLSERFRAGASVGGGSKAPEFIDLQPDGNGFDMLKGMIVQRK